MKNDMKIILGAIIVILLLLVGAYALSGSNNAQPTATPTVTPVTATPTPVPGGSTATPAPTVVPTVAPTVTPEPTVTPTPVPESGVKLTEFGYWITYPPLDPQKWSTNPPPDPKGGNIVYFDPTSENINVISYKSLVGPAGMGPHGTATMHRYGDLSGTVFVTIVASNSSNTWVHPTYIPYRYEYVVVGTNLTQVGDNTYELRFDPGVSEQDVMIPVHDFMADSIDALITVMPVEGYVKLTITDVDDGYGIGLNDEYTLNINSEDLPVVQFATDVGYLNTEEGCVVEGYQDHIYNVSFVITRTGDLSGTFTPNVYLDESYPSSDYCIDLIKVDPFIAGASTTKAYMYYNLGYYNTGFPESANILVPYAEFGLIPNMYYSVGSPPMYTIYLSIAE
jgi:hypothetical protein